MDGIRVATDLELEQPLGLPLEHLVGHALERLAQHDEAAGLRVARAEMHIREPSPASSMPPLRREHHEVERVRRLHLEPPLAPPAGLVRRVQRLGHDPLVPAGECLIEESLGLLGRGRHRTRYQQPARRYLAERRKAALLRLVEQRLTVDIQEVEEEGSERQVAPQTLDVQPAAEPAHRRLKRKRRTVRSERDRLAVQDQLPRGEGARPLDQLGHGHRHVLQAAGVDLHFVVPLVELHPGAVELELERGPAEPRHCVGRVLRRLSEHRKHGTEQANAEARQPRRTFHKRHAGHARQVPRRHGGAPHRLARHARGLCHGLEHQPLERSLAQLADHEAREKALLVARRGEQQLPQQPELGVRRALPGEPRDAFERAIDGR